MASGIIQILATLINLLLPVVVVAEAAQHHHSSIGTPRPANYFYLQHVDHDFGPYEGQYWTQRFYTLSDHFDGPGSPIILILGGEGAIEPSTGVLHPFVTQHLAPLLGAMVVQPEHRFYGESQPISRYEIDAAHHKGYPDPRVKLLTAEQALHDAIRLTRIVRDKLRCSVDPFSRRYCPVLAVGGSYSGFLSAMARLLFPDTVDMAYASSAPMQFYAQQVDPHAYYNHITNVTELYFPGCAKAVRDALEEVASYVVQNNISNREDVGVCNLPSYIKYGTTLVNEIGMMVGYTFANMNMAFYPPGPTTQLADACHHFMSNDTAVSKLKYFLSHSIGDPQKGCVDVKKQLPAGPNASISAGDWSGVGTGVSGDSWDFQTCTLLVEQIAFSKESMFLERNWTLEWLEHHCWHRFGVVPRPMDLVREWGLDDLVAAGASHILFTNGLHDGWSVGGIRHNLSDTIIAVNFPNGSHHSELNHFNESNFTTPDLIDGQIRIQTILSSWLADLKAKQSVP